MPRVDNMLSRHWPPARRRRPSRQRTARLSQNHRNVNQNLSLREASLCRSPLVIQKPQSRFSTVVHVIFVIDFHLSMFQKQHVLHLSSSLLRIYKASETAQAMTMNVHPTFCLHIHSRFTHSSVLDQRRRMVSSGIARQAIWEV